MEPRRKHRAFKVLAIFLCLAILLIGSLWALKTIYPLKYSDYVEKYSALYGVDKSVIYATIKVESNFKPRAESYMDAKGLMQLLPETFSWLQPKIEGSSKSDDIWDPETNIKYGTFLISYLSKKFETNREVFAAYHAGWGNVDNWLKDGKYSKDKKNLDVIPFDDTRYYVDKIMRTRDLYQELYNLE